MGQAQGRAGLGERRLVGDPQQLCLGLLGQQEARGEFGAAAGQGERGDVVQRNGEQRGRRPFGDLVPDPQEEVGQFGGGGGRGAGAGRFEVAGAGHRTGPRFDDGVHRDSRPAQGADRSQGAVVEGVPVEPYEDGRDTGVKTRHGMPFVSVHQPGDQIL